MHAGSGYAPGRDVPTFPADRTNLARLYTPRLIAVVAAKENLGISNNAAFALLDAGRDVRLVHPTAVVAASGVVAVDPLLVAG
jgi:hypothetical protein